MKAERLFRVLGLIDPALVEEAMETRRRTIPWKRWGALAACLALIFASGLGVRSGRLGFGMGGSGSGSSGGAGWDIPAPGGYGAAGVRDGISFLCYEGPVFPLTTVEDSAGLTAERETAWSFSPDGLENDWPWGRGAAVTDTYVLQNSTEEDITVTALYPFAESLYNLGKMGLPAVTVDGGEAETVLYAGSGSGGYQSASGLNVPYYTADLDRLDSWEEYKLLLESGLYQEWALGEAPVLDTPVTVYEFSDFTAPHEKYQAATQAMSFRIDPEKTRIFTYGINGRERDGNFLRYSYFVPDGVRREPDLKLLIVLGEDIGEYELQGFQDGGCDRGEEIDGVSCTVTRSETTLDGVLDRLCAYFEKLYGEEWNLDQGDAFDIISPALYRRAAAELLYQYSLFPDAPVDRYIDGRLDDVLSETLSQDRVLYLAFPLTVPAGGSARVECELWKMPSFDYGCSESENVGLQGYDLATRLGSALEFTAQRAALVNTEDVEPAAQNFGFDLENGVTTVELDLEREYYYMAIRVKE